MATHNNIASNTNPAAEPQEDAPPSSAPLAEAVKAARIFGFDGCCTHPRANGNHVWRTLHFGASEPPREECMYCHIPREDYEADEYRNDMATNNIIASNTNPPAPQEDAPLPLIDELRRLAKLTRPPGYPLEQMTCWKAAAALAEKDAALEHERVRAEARGRCVERAWQAMRERGYPPDGRMKLCEAISAAIAEKDAVLFAAQQAAFSEGARAAKKGAALRERDAALRRLAIWGEDSKAFDWGCRLCNARWREHDAEIHAPGCLAAPTERA